MNKKDFKKEARAFKTKVDNTKEETVSMPATFARELMKHMLFNPKNSSTKNQYTYSSYTKENIIRWLQAPSSNEKNLRNASIYLYLSSMQYQRLINYYANLPIWAYIISPLNFDASKYENDEKKKDSFRKQLLKVSNALELMNIPETYRNVLNVALREGAYYGVRWQDGMTSFVQKINADYCQITSISDGIFLYSVDMSKISEEKLAFYPEVFREMYNKYKSTGSQWQEVPAEYSVCVKADATIVDYTVPMFAATMPSLYTIGNTEALHETQDELNNYKMLAGKVPCDANGRPLMSEDDVTIWYNHISNALSEQVGLALSPFDLKGIDFETNGTIAEIDTISRANQNFWSTAGTSGLLHGLANDNSGVTKLAIKNDENYIIGILKQIERLLNYYLKTQFSGTQKFKITILPITIYNRDEYVKMYKESVPFGIGKSYYMASLGIPQSDIAGLSYLENDAINIDDKLKPLVNSHNASSDELNGNGRPNSDDDEISDEGINTRDNNTNDDRQ